MAFLRPKSREELLKMIAEHQDYVMVAGATDVMPKMRRGVITTNNYIDLTSLPTPEPSIDKDGSLHIPGATTAAVLADSQNRLLASWPILVSSANHLGSTLIRNRATLAGNLCTASPCGDMVLALVAYEAQVVLASVKGKRTVFIGDFLVGPGRTCRQADEWVEEIILPKVAKGTIGKFCKTGRRNALIIAVASMGINILIKQGRVSKIILAFGSVGPTTLRAQKTEAFLTGKELTDEVIEEAAQMIFNEVKPISDQRASADYRRMVCRDYVRAALLEVRK